MREKFKRFWDTTNPDLLRLVIILVLVGLLLAGFLLFGPSGSSGSVLPAWVQAGHVEPPDERLAAAQKENPDTVAWITMPGTNIDAPVQQYGDNDYYLRRDEKGGKDYHGCIYADYACRMDSGIWEADVLSDGQKQYAATDAWTCLNIYNLLQELKRTGNYEIAPEEKKEEHLIESDK